MPLLCHDLQSTNQRLRLLIDNISVRHEQGRSVSPQIMSALLSELLTVGANLRKPAVLGAPPNEEELDRELAEYRRQVERLRDLLPAIQNHLLAERARIASRRSRLHSVSEWARASRKTMENASAQRR